MPGRPKIKMATRALLAIGVAGALFAIHQNVHASNHTARPDLTVERVLFDSARRPTAIIKNIGNAPAPLTNPRGYIQMRWWRDNGSPASAAINTRHLLPLNPGDDMVAFWPSDTPIPVGSDLELRAQIVIPPVWNAEQNRFVPILEESHDTNNSASARPFSNLRLGEVTFSAARVPTLTVTNRGAMIYPRTTPAPYVTFRWLGPSPNNELLRQVKIDLDTFWTGGQSRTVAYSEESYLIPAHATRLQIRLYEGGTDGSAFRDIQNLQLPNFDVDVASTAFSSRTRRPAVTVRNEGTAVFRGDAIAPVAEMEFRWYAGAQRLLADQRIRQIMPYEINPRQTATVNYSQSAPDVPYWANRLHILIFSAGPEHELVEYREVNVPAPDLDFDSVDFDPISRPFVTVRNNGSGGAPQTTPVTRIEYRWRNANNQWINRNQTIEQIFPFSLSPGESGTVYYPEGAPSGPENARQLTLLLLAPEASLIDMRTFAVVRPEDTAEEVVEQEEHTVVFLIANALEEEEEPEYRLADGAGEIDASEYEVREFEGREEESGVSREALTEAEAEPQPRAQFSPRILPGNPLYGFKTLGREARALFTFDDAARSRLRLNYAHTNILEANLLADRGRTNRAVAHLARYERNLNKANNATLELAAENSEQSQALAETILESQFRHQILIGKFEKKAGEDTLLAAKRAREKTVAQMQKTLSAFTDTERMERTLVSALDPSGGPFKQFHNLEILKAVEERVPDEVKSAIQKIHESERERFTERLKTLPEEQKKLFAGYAEKAGGDDVRYLKVLNSIATPENQTYVSAAKEKVLTRIETALENVSQAEPDSVPELFRPASDGSIEGLKAIKDVERAVAAKFAPAVEAAKAKSFEKFDAALAKLDTREKQEAFINRAAAKVDAEQAEVLAEAESYLRNKQREEFGAPQNQLESADRATEALDTKVPQLSGTEDADFESSTDTLNRFQILQQIGDGVLDQSNRDSCTALLLLGLGCPDAEAEKKDANTANQDRKELVPVKEPPKEKAPEPPQKQPEAAKETVKETKPTPKEEKVEETMPAPEEKPEPKAEPEKALPTPEPQPKEDAAATKY